MKELVEYIAKSIVNGPDEVQVEEEEDENGITLKLQVADDDKARIIGNRKQTRRPRICQGLELSILLKGLARLLNL